MVRYRDLRHVILAAIQFLLYASPVGGSLSMVSAKIPVCSVALYMLNPVANLLEAFRMSVLGLGDLSPAWLA